MEIRSHAGNSRIAGNMKVLVLISFFSFILYRLFSRLRVSVVFNFDPLIFYDNLY